MKKIWAPWRMEYILDDSEAGCFICRALEEDTDRENLILHRGPGAVVMMNRYPYNNGHLLVAPNRHTHRPGELSPEERLELMSLLSDSMDALDSAVHPDGFNCGLNLGKAAGAGLEDHLHWHVVPRWTGDTNFMPVLGETKVIPQALLDLYDQLLPLWG